MPPGRNTQLLYGHDFAGGSGIPWRCEHHQSRQSQYVFLYEHDAQLRATPQRVVKTDRGGSGLEHYDCSR